MATVNHSNLSDPYLHEPKGASTATAGEIYVADGAGSGSWAGGKRYITGVISDISTASTVYIPCPEAGTATQVTLVLGGTIATADAVITLANAAAATAGTATVAFTGSAAGDIDTITPASNNTVTANSFFTLATDGASSNTVPLYYTIQLEVT